MITMKDIAREAGVSQPTVSVVLNGRATTVRIGDATKKKILETSERMGYRRNAIAQSMKTGKTNVIGILGGLVSSYSMEIIKGISDVVSKNNYTIKLLPTSEIGEIKDAARQCVEQRLAGVISRSLSEEGLEILRKELEPHKIPIVLVDSSFSHDWCSRVISDDFEGAKAATEYLLRLGHRRIMHLTNDLSRGFSRERCEGFCAAMNAANEAVKENVCIIEPHMELTEKIETTIAAALRKEKPTAVFCGSDPIAMKLIVVASRAGLKVPDDLSIIGYAGLDLSLITNPPLTTVAQKFDIMGQKAADVLFREINGGQEKRQIKLPVELIIRDSTRAI